MRDSGFDNLGFIGSSKNSSDHIEIANNIRQHIGLAENWASEFNTWQEALNYLSAEILVPANSFNSIWDRNTSIRNTARYFKVSEIVIARRALDLNKISRQQFFDFYDEYINREFSKKSKSSGGDYYATARKRISVTFAAHIENAVKSGQLLYRDAYKLTSMKGDTFNTFFTELG